ncbi:hypothetical protein EJP82_08360 [Paenibacillus anaericanus]|uniref:Uncharacterized protein n=2 Tax=Paenibacillus anaericanus TaxID=170367 RepID=A0A3S1EJR9_9BACL|nr:hypothetical protein EJP82_08360 [Paenibacillus anaericanus]
MKDNNSIKDSVYNKNETINLYYEIKNKVTSENIGFQEVSITRGKSNYTQIHEKRYLTKEFLTGLGKDLTNIKEYELNSEYSLLSLTETEYLNEENRFEKNVIIKNQNKSKNVITKSKEYTQDGKVNTTNDQVSFPKTQTISAGSYFEIPFFITNLEKDEHVFYTTIDGKINSFKISGNEDIKNTTEEIIRTTKMSTMDEKVKIWVEENSNIIVQIEEYITEDNILVTTLTKKNNL